jgi:hypothetical protein
MLHTRQHGNATVRGLAVRIAWEPAVRIADEHLLHRILLGAVELTSLDRVIPLCEFVRGDDFDRSLAAEVHQLTFVEGGVAVIHQLVAKVIEERPLVRSDDKQLGQSQFPISDRIGEGR